MTDAFMQARVMAQLISRPDGWTGTAAEIAAGMDGKLTAANVEPTLRLFWQRGLAVREPDGKRPDRWRLAL